REIPSEHCGVPNGEERLQRRNQIEEHYFDSERNYSEHEQRAEPKAKTLLPPSRYIRFDQHDEIEEPRNERAQIERGTGEGSITGFEHLDCLSAKGGAKLRTHRHQKRNFNHGCVRSFRTRKHLLSLEPHSYLRSEVFEPAHVDCKQ